MVDRCKHCMDGSGERPLEHVKLVAKDAYGKPFCAFCGRELLGWREMLTELRDVLVHMKNSLERKMHARK